MLLRSGPSEFSFPRRFLKWLYQLCIVSVWQEPLIFDRGELFLLVNSCIVFQVSVLRLSTWCFSIILVFFFFTHCYIWCWYIESKLSLASSRRCCVYLVELIRFFVAVLIDSSLALWMFLLLLRMLLLFLFFGRISGAMSLFALIRLLYLFSDDKYVDSFH